MKKRCKSVAKILALVLMLSAAFTFVTGATSAHAGDPTAKSIFEGEHAGDKDIFGNTTNVVEDAGRSAKNLIMTGAIVLLVIGAVIVGVQFTSRNSQKRQEAKSNLVAIVIGAVIVFAAVALIAFSGNIASNLSSSIDKEITEDGK